MKITKFLLGTYGTIIGLVLDEMGHENNLGKKRITEINFEHKGQIWKLKKLK